MILRSLCVGSLGLCSVGLLLAAIASAESAPSIAAPGDCAQASPELQTSTVNESKGSGNVGGEPGDFFEPSEGPGSGDAGLPGLSLPGSGASSASARTSSTPSLGSMGDVAGGMVGGLPVEPVATDLVEDLLGEGS